MEERQDSRRPTWIPIAPSPRRVVIRHPQTPRPGPAFPASFDAVAGGIGGSQPTSASPPRSRFLRGSSGIIRPAGPPDMFLHVAPPMKRRPACATENEGPLGMTTETPTFYRENRLIHLCRAHQWSAVLQRCQSHPEEAVPHRLGENDHNRFHLHSSRRVAHDYNFASVPGLADNVTTSDDDYLYHDTALGIACACHNIHSEELYAVIVALVKACPDQVYASQLISGHTPVRDAIKNRNCTRRILKVLLQAPISSAKQRTSSLLRKDRDGLYPVDYLIIGVQLGSPPQSLELLQEYVKSPRSSVYHNNDVSPLIRLLTLGTSFGLYPNHQQQRSTVLDSSPWSPSKVATAAAEESTRMARVLDCAKYLLDENPSLITICSRATGCSPLHIALRNYGNYPPLIKYLMARDDGNRMIKLRNQYGDLPLHVACSVGVPLEVLHLVLERTVETTPKLHADSNPHPLVWSTNRSGYTPIDLEWVRHIESGKGFYAARTFYPLDAAGVRKHCRKQDEYYRDLLEEAVTAVVGVSGEKKRADEKHDDDEFIVQLREDKAKNAFGMLIDRLQLLVYAAAFGRVLPMSTGGKAPDTLCNRYLLHAAAVLSQPQGPTLALPLLQLFLWVHQNQLEKLDDIHRLPIHHAFHLSLLTSPPFNDNVGKDWKLFVLMLLERVPASARVVEKLGQLPLHMALSQAPSGLGGTPKLELQTSNDVTSHCQQNRQDVVERLVECYSDSVDCRDPISNLFPFMLAASNPDVAIDTVYYLLRRSPSRCSNTRPGG